MGVDVRWIRGWRGGYMGMLRRYVRWANAAGEKDHIYDGRNRGIYEEPVSARPRRK